MAKNKLFDDKTLNQFGKDYVKILIAFLKKNNKVNTGALINSIDYKLKSTANDIQIELLANDYLINVDKGRKPGKYPNMSAISKYASSKGIPQSAVFPIARKIFKFGIEPTFVLDKTTKEIQTSPTLQRKYEKELIENIEDLIVKNIENKL
jgi:hypothetical protein